MSLIRWFRKNNTKIMAVVVIVLMIGFIGGSYIQQLSQRRTGHYETVAWFGDNQAITNYDIALARREMEILKTLQIDTMLKIVTTPEFRSQDLRAIFLSELLFSERKESPRIVNAIKQLINTKEYRISDKQINDIYRRSVGGEIYWFLLSKEAEQAGIRISKTSAGTQLAKLVPYLFKGATYQQVIGSLIGRQGISEEEALVAFSKLLSVLEYSRMTCLNENITTAQMMSAASWENELIDFNTVKIDSAWFVESQGEPKQEEIPAHFANYKSYFSGSVSDENPYGLGYKLPDIVRLEYIAIMVEDVSKTVTEPTTEEMEEYYQRYKGQIFTEQVASDPNDPNSPSTVRTKSYVEAAGDIMSQLLQKKTNMEIGRIFQEIVTLTEAGLQDANTETSKLSAEEYRQLAGDYKAAAEESSKRNKIKIYSGSTGFLSAGDMQTNEVLGGLYVGGYGYSPVQLTQAVFAIDELGASELGPLDVPKPRLYENIGPIQDMFGKIIMITRVIDAKKAYEPESINETFSQSTIKIEGDELTTSDNIYSVKEKVIKDLKRLSAMDTARIKADEFIAQAKKDGWEKTSRQFKKLYGKKVKGEVDDANNVFELQNIKVVRIPLSMVERYVMQNASNPAGQLVVEGVKKERQFLEQLYHLVPKNAETIDSLPLVMEFKPFMSYYCLKDISITRIEQDQYEKTKAIRTYGTDFIQSQSLAAVYFNPENILKRTKFRPAVEERTASDPNSQMVSEEDV